MLSYWKPRPHSACGQPWPSVGLPLDRPSTRTMFSRIASSGWVPGPKVVMSSPETAVGDQTSGCVPIVQKNRTRLTRPVARAGLPSSSDRNGAAIRPAPAVLRRPLRVSLGIVISSWQRLVAGPAGEVGRVDDARQHTLQREAVLGGFVLDGGVRAGVLIPGRVAVGVVRPVPHQAVIHVGVTAEIGCERADAVEHLVAAAGRRDDHAARVDGDAVVHRAVLADAVVVLETEAD